MDLLRKRKEPGADDIGDLDINAHIVGSNIDSRAGMFGGNDQDITEIELSNDEILEGDYSHATPPKKKFRPAQIMIICLTGVFAIGGIATIFVPQPEKKVDVASAPPQEAVAPKIEVSMPSSLSYVEATQSLATTTLPEIIHAAPVDSGTNAQFAAPAAPTLQQNSVNTQESVSAVGIPVDTAKSASPSNPVLAQIEEAKKLEAAPSPVQPAPAAKPQPLQQQQPAAAVKTAPAQAEQKSTPAPVAAKPSAAPVKSVSTAASSEAKTATHSTVAKPVPQVTAPAITLAKPAPKVVEKPAAKPEIARTKETTAKPADKFASTERAEDSNESIKTLVVTSPEAFGLQSLQEGSITLEKSPGGFSQRFSVGDRLPSGEQILRVDARSMTLVTDRSVIRFN